MKQKFINVAVEINDPENRLVSGEVINVQMVWNEAENTFSIEIPEAKKPEKKEDKPQPVNVYTGVLTNIKGTITARGNAKLNMDMKPALIKALGKKTVKAELDEAFNTVIKTLSGS